MPKCAVCGVPMRSEYHGRPKIYCAPKCAQAASIIRRASVDSIMRLRPELSLA